MSICPKTLTPQEPSEADTGNRILPILKDFAEITGSRLKIQQDPWHDITATFSSQRGIDITPSEKRMRMVISVADHISINKQTDSDRVYFSLIFGFPDDAE